ncbi:unnamed protein product [Linum tenue]|uniref:Uncharacterized protein n=1 Tax=Linum tenue TaxID=586396 RepID=A0AAV0KUM4_9ROSI|nr:unnamed protein product [Linum tenue]
MIMSKTLLGLKQVALPTLRDHRLNDMAFIEGHILD